MHGNEALGHTGQDGRAVQAGTPMTATGNGAPSVLPGGAFPFSVSKYPRGAGGRQPRGPGKVAPLPVLHAEAAHV